ncbi:MAG: hypothetical protein NT045_01315 [Candidatus Aureabacteria bacterium]|nr:hypothetical protein [Candidatus Auribacterota bacterium]
MDRDEKEALAFVCERILPEVRRRQEMGMRGQLDGGKGSTL